MAVASRVWQVLHGQFVEREVSDERAVLGAHVGDGRPVGDGQQTNAGAEELDENVAVEVLSVDNTSFSS